MRSLITGVILASLFFAGPAFTKTTESETIGTQEPEKLTIIHAGQLLSIPGEAPLTSQSIFVKNNRIEKVLPGYIVQASDSETDVSIINMQDKFVLPGLMDMHVHLSFEYGVDSFEIKGVADDGKGDSKARRDDIAAFVEAMSNAEKTLQAGYTTVRNVGSEGWNIAALKQAIASGRIEGPRVLSSMHTIRPGADSGSGACNGVEGCRLAVRRQIDMGADLIKIYASCSGSKPCGNKNAPGIFLKDELEAIVQTAHTRQLTVAAHSHSARGIIDSLRAGVDSIEHGSHSTVESHPLFRKNDAYLVPTITVVQENVKGGLKEAEGAMRKVMQDFVDNHGKNTMAAYKAGVKIAAGSDAGVTKHGENAHELQYYVEQGMPASEAIKTATVNGAALIRKSDDLGTIEAGKLADIIAVSGNPLKDIKSLQTVDFVMKDGKVYRCELPDCE